VRSIGVLVPVIIVFVLNCSSAVSVPVRDCLQNLFTGRRADCVAEAFSPRKDQFWRLGTCQRKLLELRFRRRCLVVEVGDGFSLELEILSKLLQGCFLFILLPLFKLVPLSFKRLVFLLELLVILSQADPTK